MEFYSNNQLPKNNIYTSTSTYKYNITYPISNTFKQSTYTGTNIQKNYTQSYQNYSSDIKSVIKACPICTSNIHNKIKMPIKI